MTTTAKRRISGGLAVVVSFLGLLAPPVSADDAAVLPKGLFRFLANSEVAFDWSNRYNPNGDKEPLAIDFNANLNNAVFSAVPAGQSFGRSVVAFKRGASLTTFQPAYGLTDRLSIGMNIPYWTVDNRVAAHVSSSGATLGKLVAADLIVPLSTPGSVPLSTADVQNILASGLDVAGNGDLEIGGLGFMKLQDWSYQGVGDVELGGRYQYYRGENFRGSFTGGVRFPTGYVDNPDNLADLSLGAGAYALLFQFNQDLMFQKEGLGKRLGFPEPGDFFINTTIRYDLNLPDKQLLRICDPNFPLCNNKEEVHRDLGDRIEAEIQPKIGLFFRGLIFSALYKYGHNFQDHITGSRGFNYGAAAKETDSTEHFYVLGLTYSTIPSLRSGEEGMKLPPLSFSVLYRNRFAGTNTPANDTITFNLQYFFRIPGL